MFKYQILHVQIKEYINKDMKVKKLSDNFTKSLSPFLSSTQKRLLFLKVWIFRRSWCLERS